jgi:hypothetical protein
MQVESGPFSRQDLGSVLLQIKDKTQGRTKKLKAETQEGQGQRLFIRRPQDSKLSLEKEVFSIPFQLPDTCPGRNY